MRSLIVLFSFLMLVTMGCSSEEGPRGEEFTYEVTGDVGKEVQIQFTPDIIYQGNQLIESEEYEVTAALPWRKTVRLDDLVQGAACSMSVDEGIPGRPVTIKIFRGDVQVAEHTGTTDGDGDLVMLVNYYKDGTVVKN